MNVNQTNATIANFKQNLDFASDAGDRKWAVSNLAGKIGVEKANEVAKFFGLVSSYYHAK